MACSKFIFGYYFYLPFVLKCSCGSCVCLMENSALCSKPAVKKTRESSSCDISLWVNNAKQLHHFNIDPKAHPKAPESSWVVLAQPESKVNHSKQFFRWCSSTGIWEGVFLISLKQIKAKRSTWVSAGVTSGPERKGLDPGPGWFKEVFRVIHN